MASDWEVIDVSRSSVIEKFKIKISFILFADSLKMLALERVRGKFFTRAWGKLAQKIILPLVNKDI